MKIAQVICAYPPYQGGMGNVVYNYAERLSARGYEVTIFTASHGENDRSITKRVVVKRFNPLIRYGNAAFLYQLFWQLNQFDIVHLHYPFFGTAEVVWLWKLVWGRRKRLIITYHMDFIPKSLFFRIFSLPSRLISRSLFKMADKILISSYDYGLISDIRQFISQYKFKIMEAPFGVDSDKFQPTPKNQELLTRHGIFPEDKIILFLGGLDRAHYFKGLEILLRAVQKISVSHPDFSWKLLVVGQDGVLRSYYQQMTEDFGIGHRVIFAGQSSSEDLPKYYNLADVFCLPSMNKSEAFGLVYVEAMACGKPVIGSDLEGVRTVIRNGDNGWRVPVGDSQILAEKIYQVLTDPELAATWGNFGRKLVEEKYNWLSLVSELETTYADLMNRSFTVNPLVDFIRRVLFIVPKLPQVAQIGITNRCNFNCAMCQRKHLQVAEIDLPKDKFAKIVDNLAAVYDLVLTGWGEPFVHGDIFELIEYAKKKGHRVRLTTNGSLLTSELRQKIIKSSLDAITFSIDEITPSDKVLGHIITNQLGNLQSLMLEKKRANVDLKVFIQSTFHRKGEEKLLEVIRYAARIGVDKVNISRLDVRFSPLDRPTLPEERIFVQQIEKLSDEVGIEIWFLPHLAFQGLNKFLYKTAYPLLHRFGKYCLRTYDNIYINESGQVTPCCALPKYVVGNILDQELIDIWTNEKFWQFRQQQKKICGKCDVLSLRPYDF